MVSMVFVVFLVFLLPSCFFCGGACEHVFCIFIIIGLSLNPFNDYGVIAVPFLIRITGFKPD